MSSVSGLIAWLSTSGAHEAEAATLAAGDSSWGCGKGRALLGCHISDQPRHTEGFAHAGRTVYVYRSRIVGAE
jgi:hypothetical protein